MRRPWLSRMSSRSRSSTRRLGAWSSRTTGFRRALARRSAWRTPPPTRRIERARSPVKSTVPPGSWQVPSARCSWVVGPADAWPVRDMPAWLSPQRLFPRPRQLTRGPGGCALERRSTEDVRRSDGHNQTVRRHSVEPIPGTNHEDDIISSRQTGLVDLVHESTGKSGSVRGPRPLRLAMRG